jgi:hypothetical protein
MPRPFVPATLVVIAAAVVVAQQPAPAPDVFVAPLTTVDGTLRVGKPENVSNRPGYDNQPFFAADGASLFFTSDRGAPPAGGNEPQPAGASLSRTDIYRYQFNPPSTLRLTATPEGEYSPTVTPDGNHISVIRVESDGTQRLWMFTTDGKDPKVILPDVKPVGYHAWLNENTVVLFVLGQPATLQVADVRTGKSEIVARNIGQSIQRMPNGGVSFVEQSGEGEQRTLTISECRIEDGKAVTRALTPAVKGARQAWTAWTPSGMLLTPHEGTLYGWKAGQSGWQPVADLTSLGLRNVTRLAVSPKGDRIALVAAQ